MFLALNNKYKEQFKMKDILKRTDIINKIEEQETIISDLETQEKFTEALLSQFILVEYISRKIIEIGSKAKYSKELEDKILKIIKKDSNETLNNKIKKIIEDYFNNNVKIDKETIDVGVFIDNLKKMEIKNFEELKIRKYMGTQYKILDENNLEKTKKDTARNKRNDIVHKMIKIDKTEFNRHKENYEYIIKIVKDFLK